MQVKNDAAECLKVLSSIWKESSVHLRSVALCEVGIITVYT